MKNRVAILISAYNEANALGRVISDLKTALAKASIGADIVVVNDGSADKTAQIARQAKVILINHIMNSGQGAAVATGLAYAKQGGYDFVAAMDADGQHKAEDVVKGIKTIQKAKGVDLLIGSRLINPSGMSAVKRLGNRGLTLITLVLFGVTVTDSQSGLRIFSRKAIDQLTWKTDGYEFCSEMLWRAKQQGLKIDEYPIQAVYTDYSTSKSRGQNNWNGVHLVKTLLRHRLSEFISE